MEITKIYTQTMPESRFIGVKYGEGDRVNGGFGAKWGEAFGRGLFEKIEAAADVHALFEDGDAYIGLMREGGGEPPEYWIGMFTPPETAVPEGLGYVDFPALSLGVGWVYGNEESGELYCQEEEVAKRLALAGHPVKADAKGAMCCFERYKCPRFTTPDDKGNVILDICFLV